MLTAKVQFICEPSDLQTLTNALSEDSSAWMVQGAELRYEPLPDNPEASDEAKSSLRELIDELEANDDVVQVAVSAANFL